MFGAAVAVAEAEAEAYCGYGGYRGGYGGYGSFGNAFVSPVARRSVLSPCVIAKKHPVVVTQNHG